MRRTFSSRPNEGMAGFTLPLILVVSTLVVVIMVAFASLVRVELRVSSNYERSFQARQNALYGLRMAIGQLQATAGRDQSITARAEILDTTLPSHAFWTGVWDVRGDDPYNYNSSSGFRDANGRIDQAKRKPTWLISSTNAVLDPSVADTLDANPDNLITLVGTNAWTGTLKAGLVTVPPDSEIKTTLESRYAYWVGDEGVKARVNLRDPGEVSLREARHSFMTAQRFGIEAMEELADYQPDDPDLRKVVRTGQLSYLGLGSDDLRERYFDVTAESFGVLSDTQRGGLRRDLTYAFEASDTDFSTLLSASDSQPDSLPSNFIDVGAPAYADPSGMHRLTAFSSAYRSFIQNRETQEALNLAAGAKSASPWERGPSWELLRSFYRLQKESLPLKIRKRTATQQGIAPVMTRLLFTVHPGQGNKDSNGDYPIRAYMDVQAVLWNPYNVPLAGTASNNDTVLEVIFQNVGAGGISYQYDDGAGGGWTVPPEIAGAGGRQMLYPNYWILGDGVYPTKSTLAISGPGFSAYRFTIPKTSLNFDAGEVKVFSIDSAQDSQPFQNDGAIRLISQPVINRGLVYVEKAGSKIPEGRMVRLHRGGYGGPTVFMGTYSAGLREASNGSPIDWQDFYFRIRTHFYTEENGIESRSGNPTILSGPNGVLGDSVGYDPNINTTVQTQIHCTSGDGYERFSSAPYSTFYRWILDHNLSAPMQTGSVRSGTALGTSSYGSYQTASTGASWGARPIIDTDATGTRGFFGHSHFPATGTNRIELFDVPRGATSVISIGALQHAGVSSLGQEGTYVIGSATAHPNLSTGSGAATGPATSTLATDSTIPLPGYVDLPYFLNEKLWDGYFFSSVPPSLTNADLADPDFALPNSRMTPVHLADGKNDLLSFHSAAKLLVKGAFNINSTSEEAWVALLGGTNRLNFSPGPSGVATPLSNAFSRTAYPSAGSETTGVNPKDTDWSGFRQLSPAQTRALAAKIVEQVKRRGPFVSLAHFINRFHSDDLTYGKYGALEAALHDASVDINQNIQARSLADVQKKLFALSGFAPGLTQGGPSYDQEGYRSEGAPGWLTQGDILQSLGPVLSARSDTFVIRAYGDVRGKNNSIVARAYCEATVQRFPEFVDSANPPETRVEISASARNVPVGQEMTYTNNPDLSATNLLLGRAFRVVSFRWLQENEL